MQEITLEEVLELYEQGVTWLINDGICRQVEERRQRDAYKGNGIIGY